MIKRGESGGIRGESGGIRGGRVGESERGRDSERRAWGSESWGESERGRVSGAVRGENRGGESERGSMRGSDKGESGEVSGGGRVSGREGVREEREWGSERGRVSRAVRGGE